MPSETLCLFADSGQQRPRSVERLLRAQERVPAVLRATGRGGRLRRVLVRLAARGSECDRELFPALPTRLLGALAFGAVLLGACGEVDTHDTQLAADAGADSSAGPDVAEAEGAEALSPDADGNEGDTGVLEGCAALATRSLVGPFGGAVQALTFDPQGDLLAGTEGGVYRTSDLGLSWQPQGLQEYRITAIAVDAGGTVFVGTDGFGLFRRTAAQSEWTAISAFPGELLESPKYIGALLSHTSGRLYATSTFSVVAPGLEGRILVSDDQGDSWSALANPQGSETVVEGFTVSPTEVNNVLASLGYSGIFQSLDGGAHWEKRWSGFAHEIFPSPQDPKQLLVLSDHSVVRSQDSGSNWSEVDLGGTPAALAWDPHKEGHVVLALREGPWRESLDAGQSWQDATPPDTDRVSAILFHPTEADSVIAGSPDGVRARPSGSASWERRVEGMTATRITDIATTQDFSAVYVSTVDNGVFASKDCGATWKEISPLDRRVTFRRIAVAPWDPCSLLAGFAGWWYQESGTVALYASSDCGTTWAAAGKGLPVDFAVSGLAFGAQKQVWVSGSILSMNGDSLFRSMDGGGSFEPVSVELGAGLAIAVDATDSQHVLFAGYVGKGAPVLVSHNNGASWEAADAGLPGSAQAAWIAFDPTDGKKVFLMISTALEGSKLAQGVYRSEDGGATWVRAFPEIPKTTSAMGTAVLVDPAGAGLLAGLALAEWAGGKVTDYQNAGLFRSTDEGATWSRLTDGLPSPQVTALRRAADSRPCYYVGTDGASLSVHCL